jgi:hypothetical protein
MQQVAIGGRLVELHHQHSSIEGVMARSWISVRSIVSVVCLVGLLAEQVAAQYVPDKLFVATKFGSSNLSSTVNHPFFSNISPFPSEFVLDETNMTGAFPPSGTTGGQFEKSEHLARFGTVGELPATGHQFQRREAWDIAFDMKIESPNVAPRKEAGLYFESPLGNFIFLATSNKSFYEGGPGTIGTIYGDEADKRLPQHNFSGGGGPLGDYNLNGTVDAADYTIWRDTLGSTEDFRANGSNEGASLDLIDQADYDVWKNAFGQSSPPGVSYNVGDTLRMRMVYTPPELADPNLPDIDNDPNVITPGNIEYIISLNGGAPISSGKKDFESTWKGIPNNTQISLRVQNIGTASVVNDSSKVTFNNFDFNGDLPGSGLPGAGSIVMGGTVPEPGSIALLATALALVACGGRRR